MFKRFFSALSTLTSNIESLSATFREINERLSVALTGATDNALMNDAGEGIPVLEHNDSKSSRKSTKKRFSRKLTGFGDGRKGYSIKREVNWITTGAAKTTPVCRTTSNQMDDSRGMTGLL